MRSVEGTTMENPSPFLIELQDVRKVYPVQGGEVVALNDINLKIRRGEIYGIIGLSGAGKSTLIRCINRLDSPTEGRILIDGQNVLEMNKRQLRKMRRKVSMIFQQFNLLAADCGKEYTLPHGDCRSSPGKNQCPREGTAQDCRLGG